MVGDIRTLYPAKIKHESPFRKIDVKKVKKLQKERTLAVEETLNEVNETFTPIWELIETTLSKILEEDIGYTKNARHKPWMTSEILGLKEALQRHRSTDMSPPLFNIYSELPTGYKGRKRRGDYKWTMY